MIPQQTKHFYEFGSLRLDPAKRVLLLEGKPLALTAKVFDTLLLLVERRGQVVEKDELMKLLWPDSFVEEANLTQNISILRKVLGESPTDHHYIVTVPGRGYRFVANVTKSEDEETQLIVEERTRTHIVVSEEERADPPIEGIGVVIGEGEEPKSLDKDDTDRVSSGKLETAGASYVTAAGAETAGLKPITTGRRRELLAWSLVIAFLVTTTVSVVSYVRLVRAPAQAILSELEPPEKWQFNFAGAGPPVLSPDGGTLAFPAVDASGKAMLWVRSLASLTARPLAGTEGGRSPFWSTDSRSLGFFADGKLKTLEVSGGPAIVVADAPDVRLGGGSWNREGMLLFVPDATKGLYSVAALDGTPVPVIKVDPIMGERCGCPKFLPDGRHFLYSKRANPASSGTYFASLDGKENRLLLRGGFSTTYASGFLLYLRNRILMAQAFDPERGQLIGDAHRVAEPVASAYFYNSGVFDLAEKNVLIYQRDTHEEKRITWLDRAGKELDVSQGGSYSTVRLSPDGAKLAFNAGLPNYDIWVDELARGAQMRLTNDPGNSHSSPTWSPDGSRILFATAGRGKAVPGIYQKNSNGAGEEELLLPAEPPNLIWPTSWSPDGRFILYARGSLSDPAQNIWLLPLASDRKPRLFIQNAFDGQFSPDGRWVAYTSWESGKQQIYVVPFDATKVLNTGLGSETSLGGKWQISTGGGEIAKWRGDGKEIFYFGPSRGQMMAAEVNGRGTNFETRKEQVLFTVGAEIMDLYDVTRDGKRFVMATQKVNPNTPLTLVENWTALLGNKP